MQSGTGKGYVRVKRVLFHLESKSKNRNHVISLELLLLDLFSVQRGSGEEASEIYVHPDPPLISLREPPRESSWLQPNCFMNT